MIEIGNSRIWLGDYREIITKIKFDAIVTDPPYGIGFDYEDSYWDVGGDDYLALIRPLRSYRKCVIQYPEEMMRYLVPEWGAPDECFIWAYNSNTARQSRLVGFWGCEVDFGRIKVRAKNIEDKRVNGMVAHYDWCSDIQQVKNVSNEKTEHPCQMPITLMERVLKFAQPASVFDPFMGSGTTGVACLNLGIPFIGAEIEPRYFKIAKERLEYVVSQCKLF